MNGDDSVIENNHSVKHKRQGVSKTKTRPPIYAVIRKYQVQIQNRLARSAQHRLQRLGFPPAGDFAVRRKSITYSTTSRFLAGAACQRKPNHSNESRLPRRCRCPLRYTPGCYAKPNRWAAARYNASLTP